MIRPKIDASKVTPAPYAPKHNLFDSVSWRHNQLTYVGCVDDQDIYMTPAGLWMHIYASPYGYPTVYATDTLMESTREEDAVLQAFLIMKGIVTFGQ